MLIGDEETATTPTAEVSEAASVPTEEAMPQSSEALEAENSGQPAQETAKTLSVTKTYLEDVLKGRAMYQIRLIS
ncbi:MAG: hypothetical protein AAF810_04465 [Cyanobacteria bacterium P01_D01_bin.36]